MLYGVLIILYGMVTMAVYLVWSHKSFTNKYDQMFVIYFSIVIVPFVSLALAAATMYALLKIGLVSGYFGM